MEKTIETSFTLLMSSKLAFVTTQWLWRSLDD